MLPCSIVIDLFLKKPARRTKYPNLFRYKTLHVCLIMALKAHGCGKSVPLTDFIQKFLFK
jgi:hypothetical protein